MNSSCMQLELFISLLLATSFSVPSPCLTYAQFMNTMNTGTAWQPLIDFLRLSSYDCSGSKLMTTILQQVIKT